MQFRALSYFNNLVQICPEIKDFLQGDSGYREKSWDRLRAKGKSNFLFRPVGLTIFSELFRDLSGSEKERFAIKKISSTFAAYFTPAY